MLYIVALILVVSTSARLCPPVLHPTVHTGYKLAGHVITTYSFVGQREICIEACEAHIYCSSINYYRTKKECELNNANHVINPENMTAVIDSEYYPVRCPCSIEGKVLIIINLLFFLECNDFFMFLFQKISQNSAALEIRETVA